MRTPKIEALHRAIIWINEKDNSSIPLLGLDRSPLDSNSWLAGFSDKKGEFSLTITKMKNSFRILQQFKLKINIVCLKVDEESVGSAYWRLFNKVCKYFETFLNSRAIEGETETKLTFMVIVYNLPKLDSVITYFDKYPLLGQRGLDYINFRGVWSKVKKGEHLKPEVMKSLNTMINKIKNKQVNCDRES